MIHIFKELMMMYPQDTNPKQTIHDMNFDYDKYGIRVSTINNGRIVSVSTQDPMMGVLMIKVKMMIMDQTK